MRRTLVFGTAAALAGLAAAVAAAAVVGGEDVQRQAADAEGVRAAVSAYYAALNARDIRAMEALWSRDAEPMMIHPTGPQARAPVVGWEAVRRSFEEAWPRFEVFSATVNEPVQVRVGQGGAVAVATTPVRQRVRGGAALDYTALATFAFERRDGRWLLVHNHVSRVPQ
jgi:ketosteroid isomerase-like protein